MSKDFVVGAAQGEGYSPVSSQPSYSAVKGYAGDRAGSYAKAYAPAASSVRKAYGIRAGIVLGK